MSANDEQRINIFTEGMLDSSVAPPATGISFTGNVSITTAVDPAFDVSGIDWTAVRDANLPLSPTDATRLYNAATQRAAMHKIQCNYAQRPVRYDEVERLAEMMQMRLDGPIYSTGEDRVLQYCGDCGGYVMTRRIQIFMPPRDPTDPVYRIGDEQYQCDEKHPISVQPEPARAPRPPAPGD